MQQKISKIKRLGLVGFLAGAMLMGFSSNGFSQQSPQGFLIRNITPVTRGGALALEYMANQEDDNYRAKQINEQTRQALYHERNARLGRDDRNVELMTINGEEKEMLKVGNNSYLPLPEDYWETHTTRKAEPTVNDYSVRKIKDPKIQALYHERNVRLGRDDTNVELWMDSNGQEKEILKVPDVGYAALPSDYWDTHTTKKAEPATSGGLEDIDIFTMNRWIDLNGNGLCENKTELQGRKQIFEEGEQLMVIIFNRGKEDKKIREIIYGPNGDKVLDCQPEAKSTYLLGEGQHNWENVFKPAFQKGGPGSYKAVIYYDDKMKVHDFEIKRKENAINKNPELAREYK